MSAKEAKAHIVLRHKAEELLALRGKIKIDYDWQREEETEMALDRQHFELIQGQSTCRGKS
jgi:hypothetical protein